MNPRRTLATLALAICAFAAPLAHAGKVSDYHYTYLGSPIDAPVTAIDPPPGSDVVDTNTGTHYRKISAKGSNASYAVDPVVVVTPNTPLTGATITANALQSDAIEYITPAGTIATLTYVFPSNANSRIGQQLTLLSSQIVTALTVSASGQTVTATTALAANTNYTFIKTAASTWVRVSNTSTASGIAITSPVITTGLTASGSASNDFSASTGTFKTSTGVNTIGGATVFAANKGVTVSAGTSAFDLSGGTGIFKSSSGANTLSGAVSVADATTPSITLASGSTNTGFLTISGKTSGSTKYTTADATAQALVINTAAQTVGGSTYTIPDMAGVNASANPVSTATLTAGATPAFAPKASISTYLLTPGEAEAIAGTTTGALAGKIYTLRILTSGTSAYVITFGSNFKSAGTLSTGTADAKTFVVSFLFDGTNFVEVSRTVAM